MEDSNIDHVQKEGRPDIDTTNDAMPPLYTATEIADYLHVSRSTVHRLIEDGSLREPASGRRCDSPRTTYASSTRSNQSTGRLTHGCSAGQRSIRPAHTPLRCAPSMAASPNRLVSRTIWGQWGQVVKTR